MINYAHRQLAGTDDEYPRIVKTTKPLGPFVQWFVESEIRKDPKNISSESSQTQTNKVYFAKEIVYVEDYAGTDAIDILVHIYEVVPATKPDGTPDVLNGTAGAEVGWGLAGSKYIFKVDGSIVDLVAKGKGSIKGNEELAKVVKSDEEREAALAEESVSYKSIYNYLCFYPVVQNSEGKQTPTWQVVSEANYKYFVDRFLEKYDLIEALLAAGALSDKAKAKVKKDEEKKKKKKKAGGTLPDDKKKTTDTSSGGAGWLALLGVAAAAYIYSQNK